MKTKLNYLKYLINNVALKYSRTIEGTCALKLAEIEQNEFILF